MFRVIVLVSLVLAAAFYDVKGAEINLDSCYGCHGTKFEKKALNKSKIVKDMNETEIYQALKGYKEGSYGGKMKGLMKSQVKRYNDKDIQKISSTIK